MSFVGRWWRALDARYDIVDTWPVTFFTLCLTFALSIPSLLYYTYGRHENAAEESYYGFDYPSHWYYLAQPVLQSLQLWRLPASQFTFPTAAELIFGTPLLLLLRTTEWQLADAHWKRAVLLLAALLLTMAGDALLVAVAGLPVQSGPYWLAFFLLPIYAVHVAPEWSFKLSKLSISNKAIVYFLAVHLLVVLVPASLLAATVPLGLSLLYLIIRFCVSGGLSAVLHPSRPQGMRVDRRGESTGYRLGGAAAGGGRSTAAADAARGAPRPASQYEKLLANAQAGRVTGGGAGGSAGGSAGGAESEVEVEARDGGAHSGGRQANEVSSHIRYTQPTQDESLASPLLSSTELDESSAV